MTKDIMSDTKLDCFLSHGHIQMQSPEHSRRLGEGFVILSLNRLTFMKPIMSGKQCFLIVLTYTG